MLQELLLKKLLRSILLETSGTELSRVQPEDQSPEKVWLLGQASGLQGTGLSPQCETLPLHHFWGGRDLQMQRGTRKKDLEQI